MKEGENNLYYRNATFLLCSNLLSGKPVTLQCLSVWGLQNYTRIIPQKKELSPLATTLLLSSLPGIPGAVLPALKGDCQDSEHSSIEEWEMGTP